MVRERCFESPFWCAWYLCGYKKISIVLHFALCRWLLNGIEEGFRWFLILVPRGHFKTSLMNHAYIVHRIIRNPNIRIAMVMHNLDEAKRKGRKLKAILKGKQMQTYFPEVIPLQSRDAVWSATEFSVNRDQEYPEATVTLFGVASGMTGGHYDLIIVDDGVDFRAANQPGVMETAVEFLRSLDPVFEDEESMLLVIGTLWPGGPEGYYEQLLHNEFYHKVVLGAVVDDRFLNFMAEVELELPTNDKEYIEQHVLEPNRERVWEIGQPIFPERRTLEGLSKSKAQMGPYMYAHQMDNILVHEGQRIRFPREDFRSASLSYYNSGTPEAIWIDKVAFPFSLGIITTAMDPTGGMNRMSDWCGITTCWWLPSHQFGVLLDYYHEQGPSPRVQIEAMLDQAEKWKSDIVIPEAGSMQVWVGAWLDDEMTRRKRYFRIEPFTPGSVSKGKRIIEGFHPYVTNHQFYVLYPEHQEVVDHMVNLNLAADGTIVGQSPALADTFPMHCQWWRASTPDAEVDEYAVRDDDERSPYAHLGPRYGLGRRLRVIR
jgi:hypothetical protein